MAFCGLASLNLASLKLQCALHFLLLNNIPLQGYTTFCLSISRLMEIWYNPRSFTWLGQSQNENLGV